MTAARPRDGKGTKAYFVEELVAFGLCSVAAASAVIFPGVGSVQDEVLRLRMDNDRLTGLAAGLQVTVARLEVELAAVKESLREQRALAVERRRDLDSWRELAQALKPTGGAPR